MTRRFRAHVHAQVSVALTLALLGSGAVSSFAASALGQSGSTAPSAAPPAVPAPSAPASSVPAAPTRTIIPAPPPGSAEGVAPATDPSAAKLAPERLESLVAPIALYPDP